MDWPFLEHRVPFGFAHQGGTDVAPGNTMASFEHAAQLGYTYIETDVQATSDGVLVIFHDEDLGPATGRPGRIEDLTWAEVAELRVDGEHPLPRFDEVVQRFDSQRFNVEPKADTAVDPLIDAIVRLRLVDRVCVGSFDDGRLRRVRAGIGPRLAMSPGPIGMVIVVIRAILGWRRGLSYAAVQIPPRQFGIPLATGWLVGRLHRLGLQVHVWTINDRDEMVELLDRGVDAIMTDRTELLREILRMRGCWPEDGNRPD